MKKIVLVLTLALLVVGCAKKTEQVVVESESSIVIEYESVDIGTDSYEALEIKEVDPAEVEESIIEEIFEMQDVVETTKAPETTKVPETTKAPETTKVQETTLPPETTVVIEEIIISETDASTQGNIIIPKDKVKTNKIEEKNFDVDEKETVAVSNEKKYNVGDRKVENGKTYEYFKGPGGYYWEEAVVERDDPDGADDSVVYNGRDDVNDKPDWEE